MIKVEKTDEQVLRVYDLDSGSAMQIELNGNPLVVFENKIDGDCLLYDSEEKTFFENLPKPANVVLTIDRFEDELLYAMLCSLDNNHIYSFMSDNDNNQINIMRTKWALYIELERLNSTFSDAFWLSKREPKYKLFSLIMNAFMVYSKGLENNPKELKLRGGKSENRFNQTDL